MDGLCCSVDMIVGVALRLLVAGWSREQQNEQAVLEGGPAGAHLDAFGLDHGSPALCGGLPHGRRIGGGPS